MRIVYDFSPFNRALRAMWSHWDGRSVCAVDENGVIGGCGFSYVRDGKTSAFILGLRPRWASRELYAAIMRLPILMGAETIIASCGSNTHSQAVCRQMGGSKGKGGQYTFTKEGLLKRAMEIENGQ